MKRTHHCNELREEHVGQVVTLNGWVHSNRDLGGVVFIDVRDREGRTQAVFDPSDLPADLFETASRLHSESVISVTGKVRVRPDGTKNEKIDTGLVEVLADKLEVLNHADVLPFTIDDPEVAAKVNEELRLKHRYLDLRRPEMIHNMRLRSRVATATRVFMEEQGFLEIETPTLFKSTPEGAREFLVPSRIHAGQFYALPSRRSSTSRSSCAPGWTNTFSSPAVIATRICGPIASLNSHRSTLRCRSSSGRIFTT